MDESGKADYLSQESKIMAIGLGQLDQVRLERFGSFGHPFFQGNETLLFATGPFENALNLLFVEKTSKAHRRQGGLQFFPFNLAIAVAIGHSKERLEYGTAELRFRRADKTLNDTRVPGNHVATNPVEFAVAEHGLAK